MSLRCVSVLSLRCLRCVSVLCVCVACGLRVCAVCLCCLGVACRCRVSTCEEGSLGRSAQPVGVVRVSLLGASLQDFALHREPDVHDRDARCRCTKSATANESSVGAVALQTVTAVIPPRSFAEGKAPRKVPLLPERSNRGPPIQHSSCHKAKAEGHNRFHSATTLVPKPCTSCRCSRASQRQEIQFHRRHLSGLWHPS